MLDLDTVRDILIELGIVEAGIADVLSPQFDTTSPMIGAFRAASHAVGRVFIATLTGAGRDEQRAIATAAIEKLNAIASADLPDMIGVGTPEGYAYYALYPEQYAAAATDIVHSIAPTAAVCIGVRGIGTSLSAAVSATLERHGCAVRSYTVRPHGHPFDRQIKLSPELERELTSRRDALFLVIDEGPGLSGSSFAGVANALTSLGIEDDRIVLMPSWMPDGSRFVSDAARARWRRHRKVAYTFEEQLMRNDRLASGFGAGADLVDLSAGAWRDRVFSDRLAWPVVQPQHERRKYLLDGAGRAPILLKFAGLGRIGRAKRVRAERIAAAGFGPAPIDLQHGFLATEMLQAKPLSTADVNQSVIDRMSDYLAFVGREFAATTTSARDKLSDMIQVNTREALGDAASSTVTRFMRTRAVFGERPVALDGRMLPHEWLRSGETLIKTDATDHHDDHFFPGTQDIAWDVAATAVELRLDDPAERYLLERYIAASGDWHIAERVPFYRVAYLAHRVGYATLASEALDESDDRIRWCAQASVYRNQLRGALAQMSNAA
ncbi:MAG: hypothetical protein ACR2M1_01865 [Gemmatimonadaceae bacterium]